MHKLYINFQLGRFVVGDGTLKSHSEVAYKEFLVIGTHSTKQKNPTTNKRINWDLLKNIIARFYRAEVCMHRDQ